MNDVIVEMQHRRREDEHTIFELRYENAFLLRLLLALLNTITEDA